MGSWRYVGWSLLILALPLLAPFWFGFALGFNPWVAQPPNATSYNQANERIHLMIARPNEGRVISVPVVFDFVCAGATMALQMGQGVGFAVLCVAMVCVLFIRFSECAGLDRALERFWTKFAPESAV